MPKNRGSAHAQTSEAADTFRRRKRQAEAAADTLEAVAREWYAKQSGQWVSAHGERIIRRLERDVFPWIGSKVLTNVTAVDILAVLERIDARGARETAHRARTNIGR